MRAPVSTDREVPEGSVPNLALRYAQTLKLRHTEATGACLVCSNVDRQGGPKGISPKPGPEVASHTHTQQKWPAITQQQQSSTPPAIGIPLSEPSKIPSRTPEQWREAGQQYSHPSIWCQLSQGAPQEHSSNLPRNPAAAISQQHTPRIPRVTCSQTQQVVLGAQSLPQHLPGPLGTCAPLTQQPQSGGGLTAQPWTPTGTAGLPSTRSATGTPVHSAHTHTHSLAPRVGALARSYCTSRCSLVRHPATRD